MSTHTATVTWQRGEDDFAANQYSRAHEIEFDGGITVQGSASPAVVKAPFSREDAVDPEELLVASLSTCHMLTFLDLARRAGFVIDAMTTPPKARWARTRKAPSPSRASC
jgi:organic hydroperoxide reductase OsmC/OhrA